MSTQERDPLDHVINGEWASEDSLNYLDSLAMELLDDQQGFIRRQYSYTSEISDLEPTLSLISQVDEELEHIGSAIHIQLSDCDDDDPKFAITFGYRNDLINLELGTGSDDEDPLLQAFILVDTLLDDSMALDNNGRLVASYVRHLIEQLNGAKDVSNHGLAADGRHIADVAREAIESLTNSAVRTTEFSIPYTNDHCIKVIGQQILGVVSHEHDEEEVDLLQVCYEDRTLDQEWYYSKSPYGDRMLQVTNLSESNEELDDEDDELEILLDEFLPTIPSEHDVKFLIDELLEAQVLESMEPGETRS